MRMSKPRLLAFLCGVGPLLLAVVPQHLTAAQVPPLPAGVAQGAGIVKSTQWAVALGKALFWDLQAGSEGTACASCHFDAGADTRLRNQLNPGFKDISYGANGDSAFGSTRSDTGAVYPGLCPRALGRVPTTNYNRTTFRCTSSGTKPIRIRPSSPLPTIGSPLRERSVRSSCQCSQRACRTGVLIRTPASLKRELLPRVRWSLAILPPPSMQSSITGSL